MVPPAGGPHQELGAALLRALGPLADRLDMYVTLETGLFAADDDYRVPDLVVATGTQRSDRGREGAVLVVEVRSPGDETDRKLDWYAARGVDAILTIEPRTRALELYVPKAGRAMERSPGDDGWLTLPVLGVRLRTVDGPALELDRGDGDVVRI